VAAEFIEDLRYRELADFTHYRRVLENKEREASGNKEREALLRQLPPGCQSSDVLLDSARIWYVG